MKNRPEIIVCAVLLITALLTVNAEAAKTEAQLEFSNGYRVDDIDWNIAGNIFGTNPNILSELTWKDLEIYQIEAAGRIKIGRYLYMRTSLGYGWIFDGKNRDSDYLGNNRTLEFSRSNNNADDGEVFDASFGAGVQFEPGSGKFTVAPLGGISHHKQNLVMTDGYQTIPPYGPFPGLDSTYEAEWSGPWIGVDLSVDAIEKLRFRGRFEYHVAEYYAEADWNLRHDFAHPKSFEHEADGEGIIMSVGGTYRFDARWSVHLRGDYREWVAESGTDRTFFADGSVAVTRLNEVNWNSYAIMAGLLLNF